MVEIRAPDGFNLLKEPIEITVNADGTVTYLQPEHNTGVSGSGILGDASNGYQLVVINDEGVMLPSTGGTGLNWIYALGLTLTGVAGAGLLIRKKKEYWADF